MTATAPQAATVPNKLFINGEFVDARSGETFPTIKEKNVGAAFNAWSLGAAS